jgi:curli biogenesis system outer membrane secretion channel CsgG
MMKRLAALLLVACLGIAPATAQTVAATKNGSVTIATGGTFQTVLPAVTSNSQRRSLTIQNNQTTTDNCWIQFGVGVTSANATAAKSILLQPGQSFVRYYPYVPSDEIEATCASTSDTLYVDTQ